MLLTKAVQKIWINSKESLRNTLGGSVTIKKKSSGCEGASPLTPSAGDGMIVSSRDCVE